MDITYIPMAQGFVYLCAVIDWASRKVLSHRISISMDSAFCIDALEEGFDRYGHPEIFNTDQGSQFTSALFTEAPSNRGIKISRQMAKALGVTMCSWNESGAASSTKRSTCMPMSLSLKLEQEYLDTSRCTTPNDRTLV